MKTLIAFALATFLTALAFVLLAAIPIARITPEMLANVVSILGEWYVSEPVTVIALGIVAYLLAVGLFGASYYGIVRLILRA